MSEPVLVEVEECASTQELALALYRAGHLPLWGGVLTRRQSAGRGRRGRQWALAPGSLALTVVLPAPCAASGQWPGTGGEPGLVPLRVALAVLDACGCEALELKWPNDIVVTLPVLSDAESLPGGGAPREREAGHGLVGHLPGWGALRKLGGILCEVNQAPAGSGAGDALAGGAGGAGAGPGGEVEDRPEGAGAGPGGEVEDGTGGAGTGPGAAGDVVLAGIGINLAPFAPQAPQGGGAPPGQEAGGEGSEQGAPAAWAMSAAGAARALGDHQLERLSRQEPAELARRILHHLPATLALPAREVRERYQDRCATVGHRVQVTLAASGEPGPADLAGTATGIAESGALLVATRDGLKEVVAGDVSVRCG
ncbi:biotin--[acetyl-CoA-carboxylase] ligase [Buchananella felis]|uniref:biotin--[acetyl-CoA-carboxylase] ligase n=1 Tax=Buchananella felis TaxID=3231492 RepID=UPI0035273337